MDDIFEALGKLYTETEFARFLLQQPQLELKGKSKPETVAMALAQENLADCPQHIAIARMEVFLSALDAIKRADAENKAWYRQSKEGRANRTALDWNRYCELREKVVAELTAFLSAD